MSVVPLAFAEHLRATLGPPREDLASLLVALAAAGRRVAGALARAALTGQLGATGERNVQGEAVAKLDLWANDVVVEALAATGLVSTLVSEEMAEPLRLSARGYVVCFDPVDGSAALDVNGVVGTIFSIRPDGDALTPGTAQVAAGYVMYGPATQLVCTAGDGVEGFTLDAETGEFVLTHPRLRLPRRGQTYSVNEGNAARWAAGVRRYVDHLKAPDVASGRPYRARYAGSLVADVHRTLLQGGVFLYPADVAAGGHPRGKLRLLYEAAPMALLAEQAGGRASTGAERILDVRPTGPHQRVPLVIGSEEDVRLAERFHAEEA